MKVTFCGIGYVGLVQATVLADALVICTEWQNSDHRIFGLIKEKLNTHALFDGRNMFNPSRMAENGFANYCIGRGLSVAANFSENDL
jgi:UDPglucose 6-dehydrogenase